jgi:hypothetical protein
MTYDFDSRLAYLVSGFSRKSYVALGKREPTLTVKPLSLRQFWAG